MSSEFPRIIADISGAQPGPTMVVTAGLHGNEPAGVFALQRVAETLQGLAPQLRGRFVALSGNRTALARDVRFLRRDLNRGWSDSQVQQLLSATAASLADEDLEQRELLEAQRGLLAESSGPLVFLDLHSTSGPSEPFVCFGDTLRNRGLALRLPATAILGLEEVIEGAMLGYWADRGHTAIAFEAGQHRDPSTVERHVAVVWLCLLHAGLLTHAALPNAQVYHEQLAAASRGRPRVVEILHRQVVGEDSDFEMLPGFSSFQRIAVGEVLARDRSGPIRSAQAGLLLMPRYQGQGEDGFFLAQEVAPIWLTVSRMLRRVGADGLVRLLPFVVRDGDHAVRVLQQRVSPRLVDVMHLLGYRKRRPRGPWLVFSRRPLDN